jgi:hypothetical protein
VAIPRIGIIGLRQRKNPGESRGCFLADLDCESQAKAASNRRYFSLFFNILRRISGATYCFATICPIAANPG